jgi:hypothetical protein
MLLKSDISSQILGHFYLPISEGKKSKLNKFKPLWRPVFALLHRRTAAPWLSFLYMYSVQFPAIKDDLCIEINHYCHSCRVAVSLQWWPLRTVHCTSVRSHSSRRLQQAQVALFFANFAQREDFSLLFRSVRPIGTILQAFFAQISLQNLQTIQFFCEAAGAITVLYF